ncbi:MAG: hypothetical protein ACRDRW_02420 [Pseudonocardiaceae bacterium]
MRTATLSASIPWQDGRSPSLVDAERLVPKPTSVPRIRTDLIREAQEGSPPTAE